MSDDIAKLAPALSAGASSAEPQSSTPAQAILQPKGVRGWSRMAFGVTIFASAFLLFQIQLILGKFLLPWFGGTSGVWATCLLFFQVALFAGYYYSHKVSASLELRRTGHLHLFVLALAALGLLFTWYRWGSPVLPDARWKPSPGGAPILGIVELLLVAIGLPFLLLATTAPLLQVWYNDVHPAANREPPYFLYALSNAGSLLGLLSYPILVEPRFGLSTQSRIWGGGFVIFLLGCAVCAFLATQSTFRTGQFPPTTVPSASRRELRLVLSSRTVLWFVLPALGSLFLLSTTSLLTQDVAPIPLLWVLPLATYLLSFVFVFKKRSWYFRGVFQTLFAVTCLLAVIALFRSTDMNVLGQVVAFLAALFAGCMVCHGELALTKPEARHMTTFYLTISAGGAFGGILAAIVAPLVFPAIWEYHLSLWSIAAVLLLILFFDSRSWLRDSESDPWRPMLALAILFFAPKFLAAAGLLGIPMPFRGPYNIGIIVALLLLVLVAFWGKRLHRGTVWAYRGATLAAFFCLTAALYLQLESQKGDLVYRERNFYGALSIRRMWDRNMLHSNLALMHGRIVHGIQIEDDRKFATTYFDAKSGVGLALREVPQRAAGPLRVGTIGLGAGTIAAYSRAGDVFRFYEINPAVIRLAQGAGGYFSFLRDAQGEIQLVAGDARLSLEAEASRGEFQNFDVLIVDAFNGDSIPVHLLTREAMQVYLSHLRGPESVIALHISNLAVDLSPAVADLAKLYGIKGTLITTYINTGVITPSEWILLCRGNSLDVPAIRSVGKPMFLFASHGSVWTDDYSNVIELLDYRGTSIGRLISKGHRQ